MDPQPDDEQARRESPREREARERQVFEEHLDIALSLVGGLAEDFGTGAFTVFALSEQLRQDGSLKEESTAALTRMARIGQLLTAMADETRRLCGNLPHVALKTVNGAEWLWQEFPASSSGGLASLKVKIDSTAEDLRFDCVREDALSQALQRLLEHRICANHRREAGKETPELVTLSARRVESIVETPGQVGAHIVLSLPTPTTSRLGPEARPASWPLGASAEPWGTETLLKAYLLTRRAGGRLRFEPAGELGPCFEIWLPASRSTS